MPFFLLPLFLSLILPTAYAQVVISEVHWVGSDVSTADEWLEIAVIGQEEVDISGWRITSQNSSGEEKDMLVFDDETTLQPSEYYLISNYATGESRLAVEPSFVTSAVSLPNTKLLLRLYDAGGAVIDAVDDGVGAPFAGGKIDDGTVYASMERIDLFASGTDEANWRTASDATGWDADAPMRGTPGLGLGLGLGSSSSSSQSSISSISSISSVSSSPPSIHINEVLADPLGKDDNEWIELVNAGEDPVQLDGWEITVGSKKFTFPYSNLQLFPQKYITLRKSFTGLSLSNKGGIIELLSGSLLVSELEYVSPASGVSYGRFEGELLPFCIPTEGKPNTKVAQQVIINVQSGKTKGTGSVTLNLEAKALNGTIDSVSCEWEFSDGFRSNSCNPPSHTFEDAGVFSVELRADTVCGDRVVEVLHGKVYKGLGLGLGNSSSSISSISSISSSQNPNTSTKSANTYTLTARFSEIYPSPLAGEEEWIEVWNPTSFPVDVTGWQLDDEEDGGSKPWTIPEKLGLIRPYEYVVFSKSDTKISLNNAGDDVRFLSPDVQTGAVFSYGKTKNGEAIVVDLGCRTTLPTPGEKNRCSDAESTSSSSKSVEKISSMKEELKVAGVTRTVGTSLPSYIRTMYKNIIQEETHTEPLSTVVASLQQQRALGIAQQESLEFTKQASLPKELLLFLVFVTPGWWFLRKGLQKRIDQNID